MLVLRFPFSFHNCSSRVKFGFQTLIFSFSFQTHQSSCQSMKFSIKSCSHKYVWSVEHSLERRTSSHQHWTDHRAAGLYSQSLQPGFTLAFHQYHMWMSSRWNYQWSKCPLGNMPNKFINDILNSLISCDLLDNLNLYCTKFRFCLRCDSNLIHFLSNSKNCQIINILLKFLLRFSNVFWPQWKQCVWKPKQQQMWIEAEYFIQ